LQCRITHLPKIRTGGVLRGSCGVSKIAPNAGERVETTEEGAMASSKVARTQQRAAEPKSLEKLNRLIESSPALVEGSDRAVLGEGPVDARIALVGEQPGDQEDLQGRPFVGPAGRILDRALADAGIERRRAYVTNAVKHFKFYQRGKRRMHSKPTAGEVKHYRWWLEKELELVNPRLVVVMGATAAHALAGKTVAVGANRGRTEFNGREGYITVHPSYLLRLPDQESRRREYQRFVRDLKRVHELANLPRNR
jgi:DNA polymerase